MNSDWVEVKYDEPDASSDWVEVKYDDPVDSGSFVDAVTGGASKLWDALGLTFDVYRGDEQGAVENAQQISSTPSTQAQTDFMKSFTEKTLDNRTDSLFHQAVDTSKDFLAAALEKPKGLFHTTLEQVPNMVPMMAGGWAGTKSGVLATSWVPVPGARVVGGIVGGLIGMYLGNTAVETGYHGLDVIADEGYDRGKIISEGAKKSLWVTAADAVGFGVTGALNKAVMKPAIKAGQIAAAGVLEKAGLSQLDDAALYAAIKANPTIKAELQSAVEKAFIDAAPSMTKRLVADGISQTNEMFMEGVGEYTGSAAIGEASMIDAVLEAGSAGLTSAAQVGVGKSLSNTKNILSPKKKSVVKDAAVQAAADLTGEQITTDSEETQAKELFDLYSQDPENVELQQAIAESIKENPGIEPYFMELAKNELVVKPENVQKAVDELEVSEITSFDIPEDVTVKLNYLHKESGRNTEVEVNAKQIMFENETQTELMDKIIKCME